MIKQDLPGLHTDLENLNFENCYFIFSRFSGRTLNYNFLKIFINICLVGVKPMQKAHPNPCVHRQVSMQPLVLSSQCLKNNFKVRGFKHSNKIWNVFDLMQIYIGITDFTTMCASHKVNTIYCDKCKEHFNSVLLCSDSFSLFFFCLFVQLFEGFFFL